MNLNATNMKHTDSFCPICKSSDFTLYDEYHGETFCATCGLILHRQSNHKSAVDYINEVKNNESNFRNYLNRQFLRSDE